MKQALLATFLLIVSGFSTALAQSADTLTFSYRKSDERNQEIRLTNPANPAAVVTWYKNEALNPQRVIWGNQTVYVAKSPSALSFINDATMDTLATLSQEPKTFNQLTLRNGQVYQWEKVPGKTKNQWQYTLGGQPVAGVNYVKSGKEYRVSLSTPANSPEQLALGLASFQGMVAELHRGKHTSFWTWFVVGAGLAAIRLAVAQ